jgi:ABC-type lipoprotein export system ATPase subunit
MMKAAAKDSANTEDGDNCNEKLCSTGDDKPVSEDPTVTVSNSNEENAISLHAVEPVSVRLDHLSVRVNESPGYVFDVFSKRRTGAHQAPVNHVKTILDDISGEMQSGSLTAILGGSGSGKTSLLNQMSGRMQGKRLSFSGRTLFNGSEDASRVSSAYVIQQDILLPTLTIRETLKYAADLRLPASISKQEKRQLVEEVIMELGLKEAADTRIGNHEHRGCSGGEKRRASIGVQVCLRSTARGAFAHTGASYCPIQAYCGWTSQLLV